MKLKIDFDEIVSAFGDSDINHHHIIDTEKNELIFVNSAIDDHISEKLDSLTGEKYIFLPHSLSEEEFSIIETFVYTLQEQDNPLAEKFQNVLGEKKPFRNFKELLTQYPIIKEKCLKEQNYSEQHLSLKT